jgi:signal transduction histidine kinase
MHRIDAWLVTREGARHLLHQTEETPFLTRPTQDLHLAAPFALKPGEAGTIYISYWSAGGTAMPVAIETPETVALRRGSVWSVHAAAYSILGALILFSVLLWAVLRSKIFLLYALHIASVCLFLMHGDGATFRYLWPDWPQWNVVASLPLGLGLNITAALFTRAFLDTNRAYPWIDKAFLAVIGVSALTIVAGLAAFEREAKMVAFPLVVMASLVFLFGGLRALRDRAPGAPFYVLGWASIAAAAFLALAANGPLAPGSSRATFDLVRGSIVFDALMMALALMVQVTRLRKERDELATRELATMQANMALINRINALEHRHSLAAAAAARSGRTLAVAFHDMREPLLSLRLAVQRLAREPGAAREKPELETSLAYLEGLADTLLVEERAEEAVAASAGGAAKSAETVRAQLVLDTIEHMFAGDAQAKGLRFACVGSTASLRADSVALVRILSNLAAKSVTRTQAGGIVVGCRRRNGRIWLCIVDSGPGRRAEDSTGLGLSMAERLAAQHGFLVETRAIQGGGFAAVGVLAG